MEDANTKSDLSGDIRVRVASVSVSQPAGGAMRRDELMLSDLVSEVILIGSCLIILLALLMALATALR
jgi:hypothetical protein